MCMYHLKLIWFAGWDELPSQWLDVYFQTHSKPQRWRHGKRPPCRIGVQMRSRWAIIPVRRTNFGTMASTQWGTPIPCTMPKMVTRHKQPTLSLGLFFPLLFLLSFLGFPTLQEMRLSSGPWWRLSIKRRKPFLCRYRLIRITRNLWTFGSFHSNGRRSHLCSGCFFFISSMDGNVAMALE